MRIFHLKLSGLMFKTGADWNNEAKMTKMREIEAKIAAKSHVRGKYPTSR